MGEQHGGRQAFTHDVADGKGYFRAAVKEADEVTGEMPEQGIARLRIRTDLGGVQAAWTAEATLHLSAFEHGVSEFIPLSD